jgi:hypothetical protein
MATPEKPLLAPKDKLHWYTQKHATTCAETQQMHLL